VGVQGSTDMTDEGPRVQGRERGSPTCQLVSDGSPEICILCAVRLGLGAASRCAKAAGSRWRVPRANCTVNLSPRSSVPSSVWSTKVRIECVEAVRRC
jgi:hypothetical protein